MIKTVLEKFYLNLKNKYNIFYIFIKTGVLMFLKCSLDMVPSSVNLVILTNCLSLEEKDWLHEHVHRPICHIDEVGIYGGIYLISIKKILVG